jgi:hypothetical protein
VDIIEWAYTNLSGIDKSLDTTVDDKRHSKHKTYEAATSITWGVFSFFIVTFFFLVVLQIELKTLHLAGKHTTI